MHTPTTPQESPRIPLLSIDMLQVVDAMRQTIANYLGGLPPEYFSVEISAKGEDLAQLMYTMMMTGYMFRNVQYKLDLHTNMLPHGQLTLLNCIHHAGRVLPLTLMTQHSLGPV